MDRTTYSTHIRITDDYVGVRIGVIELRNGIGDILNKVERAYLNKDVTDAFIIRDMSERIGHGVLIWGEADALANDIDMGASDNLDCLEPGEREKCGFGEFQEDAPYGEFPNQDNGESAESVLEERMLAGSTHDLDMTIDEIARCAMHQLAYDNGDDITDGASDDEI